MLKLCMKTLQCATKVLLFCFEVKRKSSVVLKSDVIQHGMLNGVMLKEEAMAIKENFQNSNFEDFSAPDGWLDCWKTTYSVKKRRIVDMCTETVTSWMERINELTEGYSLENIWNMEKSGCFFKALLDKWLVEKGN